MLMESLQMPQHSPLLGFSETPGVPFWSFKYLWLGELFETLGRARGHVLLFFSYGDRKAGGNVLFLKKASYGEPWSQGDDWALDPAIVFLLRKWNIRSVFVNALPLSHAS